MNLNQIILTTDFSDHARKAYGCAAELAERHQATLHLVHFSGAIPSVLSQASQETLFDTLEVALAEEVRNHSLFSNVDVRTNLQRSRWTRTRQRAIEQELNIDLVVISPRGRTSLSKMVLGSFADRIVRDSSVPVLLFRRTAESDSFRPQTVLVPHDFYDHSFAITPAMTWLNDDCRPSYRLLHVYESSHDFSESALGKRPHFKEILKNLQSLSVESRFIELIEDELSGFDVTLETAQGIPSEQVVQRANYLETDLVLLGKRDSLGSVSRSVIREARCSVLTVPVNEVEDSKLFREQESQVGQSSARGG
ncbi:universal stress protein [Thalassoglobus polymorphus]|uniref:Universal stress protein family protein n=1 Tax=Thalassoglobus polymorphus TaxID=2527994 RepID=A0A517QT12_9PLAN|nr:universal stress protein [Thalassoglobus polymorphus]QDT34769.1 Universal stress protein family protein [Thalassoglobus polymorphus]